MAVMRDSHKPFLTPNQEFERQFGGKNCASRFEATKAVNSLLKFKICFDLFPFIFRRSCQLIF
jgi:hypothetical protein